MNKIHIAIHKQLLLVGIPFILLGCVNKQNEVLISQYKLEGILSEFSEGTKFYLYNLETNANVDSAIVKDSKFEMEGNIINPPGLFWLTATDGEEEVYTPLLIVTKMLKYMHPKKILDGMYEQVGQL